MDITSDVQEEASSDSKSTFSILNDRAKVQQKSASPHTRSGHCSVPGCTSDARYPDKEQPIWFHKKIKTIWNIEIYTFTYDKSDGDVSITWRIYNVAS